MPSTVILAVGVYSPLLESQISAGQSTEYIVTSVGSVEEAIVRFLDGDFDIVLLGNSIPAESREKLTCLVRASGSRVPVACISDTSGDCDGLSAATIKGERTNIVEEIGELMASQLRMPASRAGIPHLAMWQAAAR